MSKEKNIDKLYKKIEELCNSKGIKIAQMCRESGVSRGSIADLKSGKSKSLSSVALGKISEYFGVSVDYLLGKEENLDTIYLNFAKKAQKEGISPDDINLAIETIKAIRKR